MRKIISLVLTFILLVTMSIVVSAKAHYNEGEYNYYVEGDEAIISVYFGNDSKVKVPQSLGGYLVTGIDEYAFIDNNITEVYLSTQVVNISENAFNEDTTVYLGVELIAGKAVDSPDTYSPADTLVKDMITTAPETESDTIGLSSLPEGVTSAGDVTTSENVVEYVPGEEPYETNENAIDAESSAQGSSNYGTDGEITETDEEGNVIVKDSSITDSTFNIVLFVLIAVAVIVVIATVVVVFIVRKKSKK